jgi:hypothetical protein
MTKRWELNYFSIIGYLKNVHVIAKDIIIDLEFLYCYRDFEYSQKIRKENARTYI